MAGEVKSALKSRQNNGLPVGINNDPCRASSLFLMDFSRERGKEGKKSGGKKEGKGGKKKSGGKKRQGRTGL